MAKILVVDDEISLQEMVKDVLSLADYEIVAADNGKIGLEKMYTENPDLVILDCEMPELDGYEVLELMRKDPVLINKPVIMLTVRNTEQDEIKGLKYGVDDYITKPFKPTVLIARIKAILDRKNQSINVNPLTFLSGNIAIKTETEKRLKEGIPFALVYIDLTNFKSFNDKYGFQRGDEVIKNTANILIRAAREFGGANDFVGHIGGDDFIIITSHENFSRICERVIKLFDESIPHFYDKPDRDQGFIVSADRTGSVKKFSIITISLAVISTKNTTINHYAQLGEIAAELKKLAKQYNHSAFVVERRRNLGR